MRQLDHRAMLDRWFEDGDSDDDPVYVEIAACSDPKAFYTCMLDLHPEEKRFSQGLAILLRQLINWIPEPSTSTDPFVLIHPDFDIQNFIVSEEGELQGIIDCDEIVSVLRTLGNESYSGWLICDWDSLMYSWKESIEDRMELDDIWEDTPENLVYYRGVYTGLIATHINSYLY